MPTFKFGFSTSFCFHWHQPTVFKPVLDKPGFYDVSAVSVLDGSKLLVDYRVDLKTLCAR